ncbi:hypothetical protein Trydic_g20111 [Trypoxylus dichotomus]
MQNPSMISELTYDLQELKCVNQEKQRPEMTLLWKSTARDSEYDVSINLESAGMEVQEIEDREGDDMLVSSSPYLSLLLGILVHYRSQICLLRGRFL